MNACAQCECIAKVSQYLYLEFFPLKGEKRPQTDNKSREKNYIAALLSLRRGDSEVRFCVEQRLSSASRDRKLSLNSLSFQEKEAANCKTSHHISYN